MLFPRRLNLIGRTLAHYKITAAIGAGGMGEVYRATDSKLGRDVALKVLPPDVASDPERLARFQREARAIAALNHPHIVTIFSVEEADGLHFLTMELVEGQSLDRLIRGSGLPVERIIEIAGALAEALAAAHEKGIVHRDLKPANVMVTSEGRVKVLDFGLAKEHHAANPTDATLTSAHQTEAGVVMGTPAYMSPEQIAGRAVDHRSDIFSLGVVLHEMATGRRPFAGNSSAELASAILRDNPPSVTDLRMNLPGDLARIIRRCLEKDPRHRIQTARDVGNEFRDLSRQTSRKAPADLAEALGQESPGARPASGAARAAEGFWIAVLPFKSSDAEMESFADGLAEDITTGLSRFRYLSVVASTSATRLKGVAGDERALGGKLGARYLLEGSIRKRGSGIRLSAQLIDTQTGTQLWAETYDRDLQTSSMFAVQDDVAARIVATVADSYGVLVHSIRSAMRQKDDVVLTPVEWQFQYFAYREQITPSAHAALKTRLERVIEGDNRQSDLWACLAQVYLDEYAFGFRTDATSLDRALAAARRAVEFDRANQFALVALAQVHFFRRDLAAFGPAAERAMALNPLNTDALGILGLQIVHTGEFERGTAIVRRAMELNANHAGWMHFAPLWQHFHKGEYEQALACANRVDVPGLFWPYLVVASACGHLGRRAQAEAAVRDLLALDPEFAAHARGNVASWHFASGLMEPILEGLRKAGLEIHAESGGPVPVPAAADVGAIPGFGGRPAIAVLPFDNLSGDPEQEYFADGLAEDLITRLSLWRSFPVIARNSSFVYKGKAVDVKKVAADLGARYVVEGSVRKAGNQVRVTAQLIDASTGQHVWAKTYDRALTDVFAVQDEISEAIATPLASDLQRAEHARTQHRAPENLEAWELYQRACPHLHRFTREDSAQARALLERAVALDPQFSTALARLAEVGVWEMINNWTDNPDQTLELAVVQARRAVALDPRDAEAQASLSFALLTAGEPTGAIEAARRAVDLNPSMPMALAYLAYMAHMVGNPPQESIDLVHRAMRLSPHDPMEWVFYDALGGAYWSVGRYEEGLVVSRRLIALLPNYYFGYLWGALNASGLGQEQAAREFIQQAKRVQPVLSLAFVRKSLGAMAPDVDRRMTAAWQKAGLE